MKVVELYGRVRYAVQIEGLSRREAARQFGIDPRTVAKMVAFSVPPGYRRRRPPARPKLDPFTGIIDGRPSRVDDPPPPCHQPWRVQTALKTCPSLPCAVSTAVAPAPAFRRNSATKPDLGAVSAA